MSPNASAAKFIRRWIDSGQTAKAAGYLSKGDHNIVELSSDDVQALNIALISRGLFINFTSPLEWIVSELKPGDARQLLKNEILSEMLCHRMRDTCAAGAKITAVDAEYIADKLSRRLVPVEGDIAREQKIVACLAIAAEGLS